MIEATNKKQTKATITQIKQIYNKHCDTKYIFHKKLPTTLLKNSTRKAELEPCAMQ